MNDIFTRNPEWPFFAAMLLPLTAGCLTLLAGTVRSTTRPIAPSGGFGAFLYRQAGGDRPSLLQPLLNVICMAGSALLMVLTLPDVLNFQESSPNDEYSLNGHFEWIRIGAEPTAARASVLSIGYRIDTLTALLFTMVTLVASLIFVFSLGYMSDERALLVEDHESHVKRRGRLGRYFAYLSLFVVAMLGLLISNNLLQIFICWELVGVFSYLLIGFYHERKSAGFAATKAFVVNRVGDAGFLIGIAIAWTAFGSLDLQKIEKGVGDAAFALIWFDPPLSERLITAAGDFQFSDDELEQSRKVKQAASYETLDAFGGMTRALWIVMGLGIFLGCVGKSAQVPLHVWLPDAMAGPTPVSALIHAATMVAAGVYLVARCNILFASEVLLIVAYTGAATMLLGATAACAQTDIKKVLAYSTCSQLGAMMLALGVGGWGAGMFHLTTHAFFKALLFLSAGSVIFGLHHEQDIRRMGGLRARMPITAVAMLIGVLAISGAPLFSGWYSKDAILTAVATFAIFQPQHTALFVIPLVTAGLTPFYMFRLWFLVFVGEPRDQELHDHAAESPRVMTVPILILAALSIAIAWGWPIWESSESYLGRFFHGLLWSSPPFIFESGSWSEWRSASSRVMTFHIILEILAGSIAFAGVALAGWRYAFHTPPLTTDPPRGLTTFFARAWYFDALYAVVFIRPTVRLAFAAAAVDKRPGAADGAGSDPAAKRLDLGTLDGWLNSIGQGAVTLGFAARRLQIGRVRAYVLVLGLTVAGLLGMLAACNW